MLMGGRGSGEMTGREVGECLHAASILGLQTGCSDPASCRGGWRRDYKNCIVHKYDSNGLS